MERERLDLLLKDPSLVDADDLPALRELVDRHPWFSGAHLLLAAGEQRRGDVLADGTVRTAAAHIPSRQVLFDLVHAPSSGRDDRRMRPAARPALEREASPAATAEDLSAGVAPGSTAAGHMERGPEPEAATEPINAPDVMADETPAPEGTVPDALEEQYGEAILSGGYLLERDAPPPAEAPVEQPKPVMEQAPPPTGTDTGMPTDGTEAPSVGPGTRMRFSAWLDAPSKAPLDPPAGAVASPPERGALPAPVDDLIDRFIHSQTPPPTPKAAFFKPQDAAKRSLDDQAGLVTETLARLYAAQGNTAKAIAAYHRLALEHPEKSSYFAALAKALEDKTSN